MIEMVIGPPVPRLFCTGLFSHRDRFTIPFRADLLAMRALMSLSFETDCRQDDTLGRLFSGCTESSGLCSEELSDFPVPEFPYRAVDRPALRQKLLSKSGR
jgi:hypothetical protein